ncbi:MAG: hypothetical protein QM751_03320 [Paludibacteraceae bacterium]
MNGESFRVFYGGGFGFRVVLVFLLAALEQPIKVITISKIVSVLNE